MEPVVKRLLVKTKSNYFYFNDFMYWTVMKFVIYSKVKPRTLD